MRPRFDLAPRRARESVMHMACDMTAWPDKYVNTTQPPEKGEQALKLWE